MSVQTLTSPPVVGLIVAVGALWTRLSELFRGGRPRPVFDPSSYLAAVVRVQRLAESPDPADRYAAYRTVLTITRWLALDLRRSRDADRRIARASALEQWELTAWELRRTTRAAS